MKRMDHAARVANTFGKLLGATKRMTKTCLNVRNAISMLRLHTVCLLVRWTTKTNSSIDPGVIRHIRRSNADTCRLAENPAFANQGERDCRRLDRSCGTPCRYLQRELIAVWGMHEQERLGNLTSGCRIVFLNSC